MILIIMFECVCFLGIRKCFSNEAIKFCWRKSTYYVDLKSSKDVFRFSIANDIELIGSSEENLDGGSGVCTEKQAPEWWDLPGDASTGMVRFARRCKHKNSEICLEMQTPEWWDLLPHHSSFIYFCRQVERWNLYFKKKFCSSK